MEIAKKLLKTADHPEHADEVAELLTDAFLQNPIWKYVLEGDGETCRQSLLCINRSRLFLIGQSSEFWLDEDGRVQGHIALSGQSRMTPNMLDLMRAGLLTLPFRIGLGPFRRFMQIVDEFKTKEEQVYGKEHDPYWTLEAFALRSDCRGKGMGSGVLKHLLEERASKASAKQVVLFTQEEANVSLYSRLNFHVVDSGQLEAGNIANWVMEYRFIRENQK